MAGNIQHIINDIESNRTSIGNNPALPPNKDSSLLSKIVKNYYDNMDRSILSETELGRKITECMKEESRCRVMLEDLAATFLKRLFKTDDFNDVEISLKLVDNVDNSNVRIFSEEGDDFSFDDIEDMNNIEGEIYKRRMLNMLISGASHYYGMCIEKIIPEVNNVNNNLIPLYKAIISSNDVYLYESPLQGETECNNGSDGGKVDVTINSGDAGVKIEAEGIILPVLLMESIQGVLELAIAHGLPENHNKAAYIMSQSDFKFAELWDQRLGIPIWDYIHSIADENEVTLDDKINYLFLELASMSVKDFNLFISNLLAKTKKGVSGLVNLCKKIDSNRDYDEFNRRIGGLEANRPLDKGEYYDDTNADKLLINDAVM